MTWLSIGFSLTALNFSANSLIFASISGRAKLLISFLTGAATVEALSIYACDVMLELTGDLLTGLPTVIGVTANELFRSVLNGYFCIIDTENGFISLSYLMF